MSRCILFYYFEVSDQSFVTSVKNHPNLTELCLKNNHLGKEMKTMEGYPQKGVKKSFHKLRSHLVHVWGNHYMMKCEKVQKNSEVLILFNKF